ncbi:MAG: DUF1152 domain-containing protein [Chloroflexota bacterium]
MAFPLNLPVDHLLADCDNILLAGAGGGFDVFTALPLYHHLRGQGKRVHLANYSFMDVALAARIDEADEVLPGLLLGTQGNIRVDLSNYPEGYLAKYLNREADVPETVWVIQKTGIPQVRRAYEALVERLEIDAIVLCDGGVDSLMQGNEIGAGTFLEDTISVQAVATLDNVPVKILGAVGMGTEVEEDINHHAFLAHVATLAKQEAYFGCCALLPQMESFQFYERAARYVFELPEHEASRIQSRLIPAVWGEFGDYNMYNHPRQPEIFLTPLTSLYWFFDLGAVAARSKIAAMIRNAETFQDALFVVRGWMRFNPDQPPRKHILL